jgi:uncharacterized membrane protein YphA (DoxX/SURF4 family)
MSQSATSLAAVPTPVAPAEPLSLPSPESWSLGRRLLFRFGFVYWALFCIPIIATQIPGVDSVGEKYGAAWARMCAWIGTHVLRIGHEIKIAETGSGDKTVDWVNLFVCAATALVATIVWSLVDRRRRSHPQLYEGLRILLRYTLGFVMFGYGIIKIFGGQFPSPSPSRLLQTVGNMSPMGILWTFMGASTPYVVFSGIGETAGALLVLFRRTSTLGALVLAGVLTNVVMLNFCYDVPVKINSAHYLAMCLVLALPDLRRLGDVLVWQRASAARPWRLELPRRWMRVTRRVLKYGIIAITLGLGVKEAAGEWRSHQGAAKTWREGFWNVKSMQVNGVERPAIVDDATRWRRMRFQNMEGKEYVRWHNMDGSYGPLFTVAVDEPKRELTFVSEDGKQRWPLALTRVDDKHFRFEGTIDRDRFSVALERLEVGKMLLLSRGFHWINEVPYNR